MLKMHAIVVSKPGGPEQLKYTTVPTPTLRPGWTLVKVQAFSINHSEIFTRQGLSPNVTFPRILGIDVVGTVVETTSVKFFPEQKVISIMGEMGRAFNGSYAEYVLIPNEQLYPLETKLSFIEAACVSEAYYTAFGSLKNLKLKANDNVLIRAATSGVGIAFARLAKARFTDLSLSGSTRSLTKVDALLAEGFETIILDQENKLKTNQKFDKILELIGPATIKDSFSHLSSEGIVCSTGQLGGKWYLEDFDPIVDLAPNSYLTSFYSGNVSEQALSELFAYIDKHQVNVTPTKVFPLTQVEAAHRYLESNKSFGKVVITVSD
ncbi:zinc-binding dehydrogenase [Lactococcus muris]|uniref:Zinc-binding dehydrogenase n=1 Tax=Lactococcus muris TaxID=2941330 RepID=A0ABV4DAJ5_9LACT